MKPKSNMKKVLLVLLFVILITACTKNQSSIVTINLDGIKLTANYSLSLDEQKSAVILLHELNGQKEDYDSLTPILNQNNYSTLALDFRGHGQSEGSKEDYSKYIDDIKAAKEYLKEKDYENIYIIGSSIGANTALKYATTDKEIKKIILLSPGVDYQGYTVYDIVNNYQGELYLIAGDDTLEVAENLKELYKGEKKYRPLTDSTAHGTELIEAENTKSIILLFLRR